MLAPHTLPTPINLVRELFVLSARGEPIVSKAYCNDTVKSISDVFFRTIRSKPNVEPFFEIEGSGVHCVWADKKGLILFTYTKENFNPCFLIEFLNRVSQLIADYCGAFSESAIKRNQQLVYEVLDEVVDGGYVQSCNANYIRSHVAGEPVMVDAATGKIEGPHKLGPMQIQTEKPGEHRRSILTSSATKKNDVFVDVEETLNLTLNPDGSPRSQEVEGKVRIKSFLMGNPALRITVNNGLILEKAGKKTKREDGTVVISSYNTHDSVKHSEWEHNRILCCNAPEGEVVIMNYVVKDNITTPVRLLFHAEKVNEFQLEVIVKVRAEFGEGSMGSRVNIILPLPQESLSVSPGDVYRKDKLPTSFEFKPTEKQIVWSAASVRPQEELILKAKISFPKTVPPNYNKLMGPVSCQFDVTNFSCTGFRAQNVLIEDSARFYNPNKWIRNFANAGSYVLRLH